MVRAWPLECTRRKSRPCDTGGSGGLSLLLVVLPLASLFVGCSTLQPQDLLTA